MRWISLFFVSVTIVALTQAVANSTSDLLQNHAPKPAPAPVYPASPSQEAAYQDYLAQLTSQQSKKDNEKVGGGGPTASALKFLGQYGAPESLPKKKFKKTRPSSSASPSVHADYGYAEDDDGQQGKSYYSQPGKHKYPYSAHKDYVQEYYTTAGSSLPRSKRPYQAYYEPDYEEPHGYHQAEASDTQQQTAPPPDSQASGPPLSKVSARPIYKGKIVNGDQIRASASEYYGGYGGGSYGGVGGFDDFYGSGYHGGYHHSPPHRHHYKSSKGPLALLLGLLPLGLLFATLVPSLYSMPFAAIPPGGIPVQNIVPPQIVGRRRRNVSIRDVPEKPRFANPIEPSTTGLNTLIAFANVLELNPVIKGIDEYGFQGLENPSCVQRLTCETLSAQKWMQILAKSYGTDWPEPLGLKPLIKAIATNNCDIFKCSSKNDDRIEESNK